MDDFRAMYPRLRALAAVVGPVEEEPDDLVQEAVEKMMRRRRKYDIIDPEAYLRRSIVNLAANRRRSLGRLRRARRRLAGASAAEAASYPSDVSVLLVLPPEVRAVLWMVDIEGAPYAEVAATLGCSENAARSRASRGRARLRAVLEAEGI